jgi:hypothetical protein
MYVCIYARTYACCRPSEDGKNLPSYFNKAEQRMYVCVCTSSRMHMSEFAFMHMRARFSLSLSLSLSVRSEHALDISFKIRTIP